MPRESKVKTAKIQANIPEALFRRVKADAVLAGVPLQEHLAKILTASLEPRK